MQKKQLNLRTEWCKGCSICVEYCPKKVLEIKDEVVSVKEESDCIYCGLCELRCPDYAIYITKEVEESAL